MRIRTIVMMILVGALIALTAIAAACGGDGDGDGDGDGGGGGNGTLTLEDYLAELDTLDNLYSERTDSLEAQFDEDLTTAGPDVEAIMQLSRDFFDDGARAVGEFVDGIDALNPPPEAEAIHNRAVTAGRDIVAVFDDLLERLQDASSEADFGAVMDSFSADAAGDEFTQACDDIQALADENGIDVTFSCG